MLAYANAYRICEVVAADATCRERIKRIPVLSGTEWAGSVRNLGLILDNIVTGAYEKGTPSYDNLVCYGVAEATAEAITKNSSRQAARSGGGCKLPEVVNAITIDRQEPLAHTATKVQMSDGTDYVFDWHATLDLMNPLISRTTDWRANGPSAQLKNFISLDAPFHAAPVP